MTLMTTSVPQAGHSKQIWCPTVQEANFARVTLTLTLKLDLDMVKMYHHTKNEVSMPRYSPNGQTDTQYENITFPHTRAVTRV